MVADAVAAHRATVSAVMTANASKAAAAASGPDPTAEAPKTDAVAATTDKVELRVAVPLSPLVASQSAAAGAVTLSAEQFERLLAAVGKGAAAPAPAAAPAVTYNAAALGLAGFALTTFVLSVFNTGVFLDSKLEPMVLALAFAYGGFVQLLAGMWEFKANNTFAATAFTSYGGFWISFAIYVWFIAPALAAAGLNVGHATGLYLFAWLIFSTYMMVASYNVSRVIFAIFVLLVIALILLIAGAAAPSKGATNAGGWIGIACALLAWYGAAAAVINATVGRVVLPVGHMPVWHGHLPIWHDTKPASAKAA